MTNPKHFAGGQALIEGVMMRYKNKIAFAVRKQNKTISIKKVHITKRPPFLSKTPLVRGVIMLYDTIRLGFSALNWSANESMGKKDEKLSTFEMASTGLVAVVMSLALFVFLPLWLTRFTQTQGIVFNIIDGFFRIGVFVGYVLLISLMSDVKRIFQYHGAEHKAVNCYESGKALTVKNVQSFSTIHKRCGTTFLVLVMIVSIFLFSFITSTSLLVKLLGRIILIPLIAGISYEILRLGAVTDFFLVQWLVYPGKLLQKLTTQEPDDKQVEVAIASLNAVIPTHNKRSEK